MTKEEMSKAVSKLEEKATELGIRILFDGGPAGVEHVASGRIYYMSLDGKTCYIESLPSDEVFFLKEMF